MNITAIPDNLQSNLCSLFVELVSIAVITFSWCKDTPKINL